MRLVQEVLRYCIQHYSYRGRARIGVCTHKTHHIAHPHGELLCVFCEILEKIDCLITAPHFQHNNFHDLISIRYMYQPDMHIDDFVQDCANSSALVMESAQSCTKSSSIFIRLICNLYQSQHFVAWSILLHHDDQCLATLRRKAFMPRGSSNGHQSAALCSSAMPQQRAVYKYISHTVFFSSGLFQTMASNAKVLQFVIVGYSRRGFASRAIGRATLWCSGRVDSST